MLLQSVLVLSLLASVLLPVQAAARQQDVQTQTNTTPEQDHSRLYEFAEGDTADVPGTGLRLQIEKIQDQTSQGCLGGPLGCRDQVWLKVMTGSESREITLLLAHTENQRKQDVDQQVCCGYRIALVFLKGKRITLRIEPESAPRNPKS